MKITFLDNLFKPKGGTRKSIGTGEGFHLDDDGKYLIFRTIRGKVVPIEISPEEALEYEQELGANVDPANQEELRRKQDELEVIEEFARTYGPEGQAQAEAYFRQQNQMQQAQVAQQGQQQQPQQQQQLPEIDPDLQRTYSNLQRARQDYRQLASPIYDEAVAKEAERQGVSPDELKEQRRQTYEANKQHRVRREDMPDKGWDSLISHQVGTIISKSGFAEKSGQWYTMQAYDLMLRKGLEMAVAGANPSEVNLAELVQSELKDFSTLRRSMQHYEHFKESEDDYSVEANLARGVKWLSDNLTKNPDSDASRFLQDYFDTAYDKMYNDFNAHVADDFEPVDIAQDLGIPVKKLPKELPASFSGKEASAVKSFRERLGKKWAHDRQASMHSIARTFDAIPVDERAKAVGEFTHATRGLHPTHRRAYDRAIEDITKHDMDVNMDAEMDSILRLASMAARGTTEEKVKAIQQMAGHMGRIDAQRTANLLKGKYSGGALTRKVNDMWNQVAMQAGGVGGEGPEILGVLLDDDRRKAVIIDNANLKIRGGPARSPSSNIEVPKEAQVAMQKKLDEAKGGVPQLPQGWSRDKNVITTDDGYNITINGAERKWQITAPDGSTVTDINMDQGIKPGMSAEDKHNLFRSALTQARVRIMEHQGRSFDEIQDAMQGEGQQEAPAAKQTPAKKTPRKKAPASSTAGVGSQMFGFAQAKVTKSDRQNLDSLTDKINETGGKISAKVPGVIYQVTGKYGQQFDVAFDSRDNKFKYLDSSGEISYDEAMKRASQAAAPAQQEAEAAQTEPPAQATQPERKFEVKEPINAGKPRALTKEERDAARPPAERAILEAINEMAGKSKFKPPKAKEEATTEAPAPEETPEPEPVTPEPVATEPEQPEVEPLAVSQEFQGVLTDTSRQQFNEISSLAKKYNLTVEQKRPRDFDLVSPDGKRTTIAANKKGELFVIPMGGKGHVPYTAKDAFETFNSEDFHETVREEPVKEDNKKRGKKDAWKEQLPKVKKPKEPIEWNDEEYGEHKFVRGKPTGGFVRYILHNEGYTDDVLSGLPDNVRNALINATTKEYTGMGDVEHQIEQTKSITNIIQSFFSRRL